MNGGGFAEDRIETTPENRGDNPNAGKYHDHPKAGKSP
jgi:hypothetical protein